ncbi:MAG: hypothetical protein JSS56_21080, partial [Proteobacteria bacterium]|nr:hypothetical protein [Pseudomonadota bacterium]
RWSEKGTRQSATSQSTGTAISAKGGDVSLKAGRDITGEAAQLNARDTLSLEAKGKSRQGMRSKTSFKEPRRNEVADLLVVCTICAIRLCPWPCLCAACRGGQRLVATPLSLVD